jgi:hypothetical protein
MMGEFRMNNLKRIIPFFLWEKGRAFLEGTALAGIVVFSIAGLSVLKEWVRLEMELSAGDVDGDHIEYWFKAWSQMDIFSTLRQWAVSFFTQSNIELIIGGIIAATFLNIWHWNNLDLTKEEELESSGKLTEIGNLLNRRISLEDWNRLREKTWGIVEIPAFRNISASDIRGMEEVIGEILSQDQKSAEEKARRILNTPGQSIKKVGGLLVLDSVGALNL